MKLFVSAAALLLVVPFCGAACSKELTDCLTAGKKAEPACVELVTMECNSNRPSQTCMLELLGSAASVQSICRTTRCVGRGRPQFGCMCDSAVVDCEKGGEVEGSCQVSKCCNVANSDTDVFRRCLGAAGLMDGVTPMDGSEL